MVPRWAHNPKAAGSTPASATKNGAVAQLGEHLPCKQRVASSILAGSTIRFLNSVVRVPARHAGSRWFKSSRKHQNKNNIFCGHNSIGRMLACQVKCYGFESRCPLHEPLAQSAEHLTFNQGVTGSIPVWLTIKI